MKDCELRSPECGLAHLCVTPLTYRPLDVPPEPVVEHVGEVEAVLLLRLDRLLAHEPEAVGDDL